MAKVNYTDWLREALKRPGKSQAGLARHLGLSPAVVNRMVSGERPIRLGETEAIESYLGERPSDAERTGNDTTRGVFMCPVRDVAIEGAWREDREGPRPSLHEVPVVPDDVDPAEQYAVQIGDLSVAHSHAAEFAICASESALQSSVRVGDTAHISYLKPGTEMRQVLIRRLELVDGRPQFVSLSGNGRPLPRADVEIHGIVIARHIRYRR